MVVRLCFLLLLSNYYFCNGFNFDAQFPIVYSDPHNRMGIYSNKSSYFGYSTILYGGNNETQPWIQIGSPRSEDPSIPVSKPGVIFRCKLLKECSMITVDRDIGVSNYYGYTYTDIKKDAWIGSTMDILPNNDVLVVCGFRWSALVQSSLQSFMMGSCYWSNLDDRSVYRKVLPLLDRDRFYYQERKSRFYNFALGQSGFSAHLALSKHGPILHAGAPGVLNWAGASLLISNLTKVYAAANIPQIKYTSGSLYGYAVTSGYYFGKQELLFVSSSPKRNKYLGEVLVCNFQKETNMELDVRDSKQGSQVGEYFGAALASGDINSDGYTDLLVGAPFYKAKHYNEGRVYVFHGNSKALTIPPEGQHLVGFATGGQFGSTIAYLGDFDLDGYGDFAIAAPYEEKGSGTIYIYRGSANGIIPEPSQVIRGNSIVPNIKGFGISFSKATDIDRNGYEDLAVGAYLSGHAIILRARPVLKLKQSLKVWGDRFLVSTTVMEVCLWFEGSFLPKYITVNRTITLDKNYGRLSFENPKDAFKEETLQNEQKSCANYTVNLKEAVSNLEQPVNIKISQKLVEENRFSEPFFVGISKVDKFCVTCPVMGPYVPLNTFVSFALGCGDDNICKSRLSFHTSFSGTTQNGSYVIGSTDYITMTTQVSNSGEKAYATILIFELPENVYVAFTPKFCAEGNSTEVIICMVANPLQQDNVKEIPLKLSMSGILTGPKRREIPFVVTIKTSSENSNDVQRKTYVLPLISEADILLTGKSNQLTYSYGNIKNGNSTFSHIYQIQTFGKSPVDEVILHIHIPVSIKTATEEIKFLKLHPLLGLLAGQPITCKNLTYVEYVNELSEDDSSSSFIDPSLEILREEPRALQKRSTNLQDLGIVYTNNLNETDSNQTEYANIALETNRTYIPSPNTYVIDCGTANTRCATIRCVAGPFRSERHVGVVQMKAFLDVSALKDLLGVRTQIVLFTSANVTVENFSQSGNKPDHAIVMTTFVGELISTPVAIWIVLLTIVVGLLLLLILTLGLYRAGFFKRERKLELEALKKQENQSDIPTNLCFLDFQLSRYGSPACDLSYFIYTCTDQNLRTDKFDELLETYHASLVDFLNQFSLDGEKLFPYSALHEQMRKFAQFGILMTSFVVYLMLSDNDEIPDMGTSNNMAGDEFNYVSKNEHIYLEKMRDVVLDSMKRKYIV